MNALELAEELQVTGEDCKNAAPAFSKVCLESASELRRLKSEVDSCQNALATCTTLRDQFAMAALSGLISIHGTTATRPTVAEESYKYADAMLKSREAGK